MRVHRFLRRKTPGQALVIIAGSMIFLLLLLGLMLDLGQIFLAKAYLRRTTDAASLAAAAQFREGRAEADLVDAAREVAHLNNIDPDVIDVKTCKTAPSDTELCVKSGGVYRKLVRVKIGMTLPLTFLSLLGPQFRSVKLEEASTSEAASMDLVLVLDVSESMTWNNPVGNKLRDPKYCSENDNCDPFQAVKTNAQFFIDRVLDLPVGDEQDRVSIVTFANGWSSGLRGTTKAVFASTTNSWTSTRSEAWDYINDLDVYYPDEVCSFPPTDYQKVSPCRYYSTGSDPVNFLSISCPQKILFGDQAVSACGTTNLGGGLYLAGTQFANQKRLEALWVVVVLTDGVANSSFATEWQVGEEGEDFKFPLDPYPLDPDYHPNPGSPSMDGPYLPFAFCPDGTWTSYGDMLDPDIAHRIWCQDNSAESFHNDMAASDFDAADFTWEEARFVACAARDPAEECDPVRGQGATIFAIGLGDQILALDEDKSAPYGGFLLRKIAAVGDDGNPATDPCNGVTSFEDNCGNYYYAQSATTDLRKVFEAIASRIFTRLTK